MAAPLRQTRLYSTSPQFVQDLDSSSDKREALPGKHGPIGSRHLETFSALSNLGMILNAKGDRNGAGALLREALQGMREALGNRHPATISAVINLSFILKAMGDVDGAGDLLFEALQASRQTLGERHPETLVSIYNLALLQEEK